MKKTLGRKILPLFVGAIFICAFASSAGAIPLTYTDIDSDITYTLNIEKASKGTHLTATFTIATGEATPSDLRVGWVAFELSPKGKSTVGAVNDVPDSTGKWSAGNDKSVKLPWGSNGNGKKKPFQKEGWVGFYSQEIVKEKGKSGGLALAANTPSSTIPPYTFEFKINDPDMLFSEEMPFEGIPFKVGFYGEHPGKKDKIKTSNAPGTFSSVPEPATLLLVGSGLLLVGLFGRRKFKRGR